VKVLIVDDAAFMRMMLKNILVKEGHECHEAGTGAEALVRYNEVSPDVVTMDITMPDMDGITAARALKTAHPDARIIMCSAMGQQGMVMDAITAGASDFIVKPFKPERVMQAVQKALGGRA
jgi:two-component system chemotaxis response regulator CheY